MSGSTASRTPGGAGRGAALPAAADVALVAAGGAAGSLLRAGAALLVPGPVGTLAVNVLGALLLGLLLETLLLRAGSANRATAPRDARLRLLLGTGVLGGFTTYSLLAADAAGLLLDGRIWAAAAIGLGSVVLGAVGAALGVALARGIARRGPARSGGAA